MYTTLRSGFTLIELLVAIAVIGMLASTVLASVSESRVLARDISRLQLAKQIQNSLEMYRNSNGSGRYPCVSITLDVPSACEPTATQVRVTDNTPQVAGGWEARQHNFKALMMPYILEIPDDAQLSGSSGAGAYPNIGSIVYVTVPTANYSTYSLIVYRESKGSCTITHNGDNNC